MENQDMKHEEWKMETRGDGKGLLTDRKEADLQQRSAKQAMFQGL